MLRLLAPFLLFALSAATVPTGPIIQTFAGTDFTFQADGKQATAAAIGPLYGVTGDSASNLYIADAYYRVYRLGTDGIIHAFAGNGLRGCCANGTSATAAQLLEVDSVAVASDGSVYVGMYTRIQRVATDGKITLIAGTGVSAPSGDGGLATAASFGNPRAMIFDKAGNLYFADDQFNRVRKIGRAHV